MPASPLRFSTMTTPIGMEQTQGQPGSPSAQGLTAPTPTGGAAPAPQATGSSRGGASAPPPGTRPLGLSTQSPGERPQSGPVRLGVGPLIEAGQGRQTGGTNPFAFNTRAPVGSGGGGLTMGVRRTTPEKVPFSGALAYTAGTGNYSTRYLPSSGAQFYGGGQQGPGNRTGGPQGQMGQGQPTMFDEYGNALASDAQRLQQAADAQYQRLDEVNRKFEAGLATAADRTRAVNEAQAEFLNSLSAEERANFEAEAKRVLGEFQDTSAQLAQTQIYATRRSAQESLTQIESDPNLTPAQRMAMKAQVQQQVSEQASLVASQLGAEYNQTRAQIGLALNEQRLNSIEMRQALATQAAQLRVAGEAAALNYEVGGMVQLAEMIRSNPQTVISRASAIAQMLQLRTAGGGGGGYSMPSSSGGANSGKQPDLPEQGTPDPNQPNQPPQKRKQSPNREAYKRTGRWNDSGSPGWREPANPYTRRDGQPNIPPSSRRPAY